MMEGEKDSDCGEKWNLLPPLTCPNWQKHLDQMRALNQDIAARIEALLPELKSEVEFQNSHCGLLADLGFPRDRMRSFHHWHYQSKAVLSNLPQPV